MSRLRASALLLAAAVAALAGGLLAGRPTSRPAAARVPSRAVIAQARADAMASVAERIYFQEVFGAPNSAAFQVIGTLPGLTGGLRTGDLALARRTLNHVVVRHAVHERVTLGGRTLLNVGLKFVVAGQPHPLYAADGTYLGQMEVSIQDVIGFVKLLHRLAGVDLVVRGRLGHAKSSLSAALRTALPASGPVTIAGRPYIVSSFHRVGFAGEPLSVWILDPAGA